MLPNYMDIFSWSLPFVTEKVTEMLFNLIKPASEAEDDDDDEDTDEKVNGMPKLNALNGSAAVQSLQKRGEVLRNKVKFVSKMLKMNKNLREQSETIVKAQVITPDNKISSDILSRYKDTSGSSSAFHNVRKADLMNEKRPMN